MNEYLSFCEELNNSFWKEIGYDESFLNNVFDLEHLPEPYIQIGDPSDPLYFLTTNPGQVMKHQKFGSPFLNKLREENYDFISKVLGDYYLQNLPGAARYRLKKMVEIYEYSHKTGLFQVEALPFHSKSLNKYLILRALRSGNSILNKYSELLSDYLCDKDVISINAVGTKNSITIEAIKKSRWLNWIFSLTKTDTNNLEIENLITNEKGKVTSAFIYSIVNERIKGHILMMGSNNIPKYIKPIVEKINKHLNL